VVGGNGEKRWALLLEVVKNMNRKRRRIKLEDKRLQKTNVKNESERHFTAQ